MSFPDAPVPFGGDPLSLDHKVASWADHLLRGDLNFPEIHNASVHTTTTTTTTVAPPTQPLPFAPIRNNLTPTRMEPQRQEQLPFGLHFLTSNKRQTPAGSTQESLLLSRNQPPGNSGLFDALPPIPTIDQLTGSNGIFGDIFPSLPIDPTASNNSNLPDSLPIFDHNFDHRNAPLPSLEMLGLIGTGFPQSETAGGLNSAPSSSLPAEHTSPDMSLPSIPSQPSGTNNFPGPDLGISSGTSGGSGFEQNAGNAIVNNEPSSNGGIGDLFGGQPVSDTGPQTGGPLDTNSLTSGTNNLLDILGASDPLAGNPETLPPSSPNDLFGSASSPSGNIAPETNNKPSSLNDLFGSTSSSGNVLPETNNQPSGLNDLFGSRFFFVGRCITRNS